MIYRDSRTAHSDLSLSHGQVAWATSGGMPLCAVRYQQRSSLARPHTPVQAKRRDTEFDQMIAAIVH